MARADQIAYFADTADTKDWFSLAIKSYAFNRTREFNPGDELLFRPVLYFLLGTEKWLYGYNFVFWQITGFILHLGVIWWLLKLLLLIRKSIFAPMLTALYSVLYLGMEMVVWHHLHGYVLFVNFALAALYNLYLYDFERRTKTWRLWLIAVLLSMASFTYEVGVVYSFIFAVYLWVSTRKTVTSEKNSYNRVRALPSGPALILLLPFCLYMIASGSDFLIRGTKAPAGSDIISKFKIRKTATNAIIADSWWSYGGLFPSQLEVNPGDRIKISPSNFFNWSNFVKVPFWKLLLVIVGGNNSVSVSYKFEDEPDFRMA